LSVTYQVGAISLYQN